MIQSKHISLSASFGDAITPLPSEGQLPLLTAIIEYALTETKPGANLTCSGFVIVIQKRGTHPSPGHRLDCSACTNCKFDDRQTETPCVFRSIIL